MHISTMWFWKRVVNSMRQNISLEEAQSILTTEVSKTKIIEVEKLNIREAQGRVLAENIYSTIKQPPFNRSPLDGYALRAEDSKGAKEGYAIELEIIEEICAGSYPQKEIKKGMATRIMTGAPIPKGADCVIRQENTIRENHTVQIYEELSKWDNYCFAGEDIKKDQLVLEKESLLNFAAIGVIASLGIKEVLVYRKPKVGVLSTGDELMDVGETLLPGKIYNSNLYTIGTRLQELSAESIMLGSAVDHMDIVCERIKESLEKVDILITTGGVSVGKKDILKDVMKKLGAEVLFWRVDIKPGTPVLCSVLHGKLVISLSGNPAASTITFELLVRPILAKYARRKDVELRKVQSYLKDSFLKKSSRRRILRGKIVETQQGTVVQLPDKHSSGVLSSMIGCNCLVDVPGGSTSLKEGDKVQVFRL